MNSRLMTIFASALLLGACTKDPVIRTEADTEPVSINLLVNSLSVNDPAAMNQDQTFSSLAIYIYDDATSTLEQSALLTSFTPITEREIPIETLSGTKVIYLIANYEGKIFKRLNSTPLTLTTTTPRQDLESMTTESPTGFISNSLLMVGKRVVEITTSIANTTFDLPLRRLQSRVDVHVYKGSNFGNNVVTLKSIVLHNQVLNSEVKFDYAVNTAQMLPSPIMNISTTTISTELSQRIEGSTVSPSDAQALFYSFQNLVTVSSPLGVTTPYLEIAIESNGTEHIYKCYLTDVNQINNKYSLLQNNVYRIIAILDQDSKIVLEVSVLPWNKMDLDYQRPITANDFSFGAWGTSWGGINARTINSIGGIVEDAVFQFELKSPVGAAWVATLTNGLNFGFASSTAGTTTPTVSNGFTRPGVPSIIAVRAVKRWADELHDTEFYITVEGKEIVINPLVGSQRQYPGTDTRIKITQVASYTISL